MRMSDWSSDVCSSDLIPRECWPGSRTKAVSTENTGNPPVPGPTDDTDAPIEIAIMVCPQAGASTIYGMYGMLASPGRDWAKWNEGAPTDGRLAPPPRSRAQSGRAACRGRGEQFGADSVAH